MLQDFAACRVVRTLAVFGLAALLATGGIADEAAPKIDSGDTAWMLVSTAFVLMMIIPGLALFYGGMVSKENVLGVLAQSFAVCALISVLWVVYGYSFAFTQGPGPYLGGSGTVMLAALGLKSVSVLAPTIPESVYIMFQLTFAAITCALVLGAVATRIKFSAMLVFMAVWFTLVYIPIAHWVWGDHGWLGGANTDKYNWPVRPRQNARLCRRHGRAYQRRHRRPGRGARDGQRLRFR